MCIGLRHIARPLEPATHSKSVTFGCLDGPQPCSTSCQLATCLQLLASTVSIFARSEIIPPSTGLLQAMRNWTNCLSKHLLTLTVIHLACMTNGFLRWHIAESARRAACIRAWKGKPFLMLLRFVACLQLPSGFKLLKDDFTRICLIIAGAVA